MLNPGYPPSGTFRGVNFMTPTVLGYYKLRKGWAELSEGRGIVNEPIFGVTLSDAEFGASSQMFHNLSEARQYIADLSA